MESEHLTFEFSYALDENTAARRKFPKLRLSLSRLQSHCHSSNLCLTFTHALSKYCLLDCVTYSSTITSRFMSSDAINRRMASLTSITTKQNVSFAFQFVPLIRTSKHPIDKMPWPIWTSQSLESKQPASDVFVLDSTQWWSAASLDAHLIVDLPSSRGEIPSDMHASEEIDSSSETISSCARQC